MKNILILSASPRKNGNSTKITEQLHTSFDKARVLFLSDFPIMPCIDCKGCKKNTREQDFCALDSHEDRAKELFTAFQEADTIFIVSPIYFYHAPSQLKAFIDRSQRYWFQSQEKPIEITKKIHTIAIASRKSGEKLPQGLQLSIKYFAPLVQAELASSLCLYELEEENDYSNSPNAQRQVMDFIKEIQNPMPQIKESIFEKIKDYIFQTRCMNCKTCFSTSSYAVKESRELHSLCPDCIAKLTRKEKGYCANCGIMQIESLENEVLSSCKECEESPVAWEDLKFYGAYEGLLKDIILYTKYHNKFIYTKTLAQIIQPIIAEFEEYDFLVPMPMHVKKLKERGYNQCVEIAKELNKGSNIAIELNALYKIKETLPQSGLSRKERYKNLKNSFEADKEIVKGKNILLFDDVSTTSVTLREATKSLLKAGANKVYVVFIANTPNSLD